MDHQIYFSAECPCPEGTEDLLDKVVAAALTEERVQVPCEISILVTDDAGIREINGEMRHVDSVTDVLSFPMFDLSPGVPPEGESCLDVGTGLCPLGDICISVDRAKAQAEEYGHSLERELAYLAVHSVLHLLGYDHTDEGREKARMRAREEAILNSLGLGRTDD